jgi:hypothetical protein
MKFREFLNRMLCQGPWRMTEYDLRNARGQCPIDAVFYPNSTTQDATLCVNAVFRLGKQLGLSKRKISLILISADIHCREFIIGKDKHQCKCRRCRFRLIMEQYLGSNHNIRFRSPQQTSTLELVHDSN